MSKKSFVIILVLSVVVTYGVAVIDVLINGNILAGKSGFPFRFGSTSLFGGSEINYPIFILDIVFWFVVIFVGWKLISKLRF